MRPRVVVYGVGFIATLAILVFAIGLRQPVGLDLHRMSGAPPYVTMSDGRVQNSLELRIQNRGAEPRAFTVSLVPAENGDDDGTELLVPGGALIVEGEATRQFPMFVVRPAVVGGIGGARGGEVILRVSDDQGFSEELTIEFLAGARLAKEPRQP